MADDTNVVLELFEGLEALVVAMEDEGYPASAKPYRESLERHRARYFHLKNHEIVRGITMWGNAMKWFVYGCVAGGGQTNAHGAYVNRHLCAFCHEPVDKPPRRRAVLEEE
jgi:hypothetical protein